MAKAKPGAKLLEPPTEPGYALPFPHGVYAIFVQWPEHRGKKRNPFLWLDLRGKNRDLYYERMQYGRPVASDWASRTEPYDRGTGEFLDVAFHRGGVGNLPAVTPRVRAILERLPMTGVEFLPHRVSVEGAKADYFIVHPTRMLDCLDVEASQPTMHAGLETPSTLVFHGAIPADAHVFRIASIPRLVIASPVLVDVLRDQELSGLDFLPIASWTPGSTA